MNTGNSSQQQEAGTVVIYITDNGLRLAESLRGLYPDALTVKFGVAAVHELWKGYKNLIFIMAAGIVVRTIAPLVKDKKTDPAVVVLDEKGRFAISLLSGHLGGANRLAGEIAGFLGGEAVITTASDINGMTSIDIWARDNNLTIENWNQLPAVSSRLLKKGSLKVYSEADLPLPPDFSATADSGSADILITNKSSFYGKKSGQFIMRPGNIVVGFGCNSNTQAEEIEDVVNKIFGENNLSFSSIHSIATLDKKGKEPGLIAFAGKHNIKVSVFTPEELNRVKGISRSEAAFRATGANAVAEPAALLAAGAGRLLLNKQKSGNVTIALAEIKGYGEELMKREKGAAEQHIGRIYIVGTGPGDMKHITPLAQDAIRKSDVIVGYNTYLTLIEGLIKGKEIYSTGMTREVDRCKKAVELAKSGRSVSVISGGDPGVYAMAGLVFEVLREEERKNGSMEAKHCGTSKLPNFQTSGLAVEVIPGISALNACAARLGAPLMHDFASISLSDRLTSWDLIEKRLEAASMADFVIVIYNPKSMGRTEQIRKAQEIILRHRDSETPVGIVKGAMRDDEKVVLTTLGEMTECDIDMQTTVIVGNSNTFRWNDWMITPRGYEKKFKV